MPAPVSKDLQYQQFIDFATSKGVWRNTLLMSQNTGGNLSIVAKPRGDFIFNRWRDKGSQRANDDIRAAFKKSVIDLFGVKSVDQLPESVQSAMKLDDYDQGKPLSVRRIRAVKAAVDQQLAGLTKSLKTTFDFLNYALDYTKAHNPDLAHIEFQHYEMTSDHQERARAALTACKGDIEAYELIRSDMFSLVYQHDSWEFTLRDEADVKGRVGKILANLYALRQEVGKDLRLYNAMKPFLWTGQEVDLSRARLREMVNAVKDLDVSALLCLTQNASSKAIHDAAQKLDALLTEAFSKITPPGRKSNWQDLEYKQMLASMIFAKAFPNEGDLRTVQKKLTSRPATKLMKFYDDTLKESEDRFSLGRVFGTLASDARYNLVQLKDLVDKCCGGGPNAILKPIKPFSGTVTERDIGLE